MPKTNKKEYSTGDETEGGAKISGILGASEKFIVYLTAPDRLHWEKLDEWTPKHFYPITSRFNHLNARIEASIALRRSKPALKNTLGRALYSAVQDGESDQWEQYFLAAEERIVSDCEVYCRWYYILTAFATLGITAGIVLLLGLIPSFSEDREFAAATIGGALGAFLSALLRIRDLEIPTFCGIVRQTLHAVTRTLFGAAAGFVLAALHKGELILSALEANPYAIFGFSIVAGFSERFLPNLMTQFESKHTSEQGGAH